MAHERGACTRHDPKIPSVVRTSNSPDSDLVSSSTRTACPQAWLKPAQPQTNRIVRTVYTALLSQDATHNGATRKRSVRTSRNSARPSESKKPPSKFQIVCSVSPSQISQTVWPRTALNTLTLTQRQSVASLKPWLEQYVTRPRVAASLLTVRYARNRINACGAAKLCIKTANLMLRWSSRRHERECLRLDIGNSRDAAECLKERLFRGKLLPHRHRRIHLVSSYRSE